MSASFVPHRWPARSRSSEPGQRWQQVLLRVLTRLSVRVQALPRDRALRWGVGLGRLSYALARKQRRFAERNLRLAAFPGPATTARERDAVTRRVFESFGKVIVDFLRGPALTPADVESLVHAEGFEHIENALARGRGVVLVTAHMGNWEMLGRWLAGRGVPLTVVARDPKDPDFSAWVRHLRQSAGLNQVSKGGSARELLSLLKKNKVVGLLPDQNSGDIFVPFFGVPAGTVAGPASLALHTGAPIIPSYCVFAPDNTYRLVILPPIDITPTGDRDADIRRIMGAVNDTLSTLIQSYPDQWLWLHNRWKSAFEDKNHARCWTADNGGEAARVAAASRWEDGKPVQ